MLQLTRSMTLLELCVLCKHVFCDRKALPSACLLLLPKTGTSIWRAHCFGTVRHVCITPWQVPPSQLQATCHCSSKCANLSFLQLLHPIGPRPGLYPTAEAGSRCRLPRACWTKSETHIFCIRPRLTDHNCAPTHSNQDAP